MSVAALKPTTVPTVQYRTATFEFDPARASEETRTVELSLSSEAPVRQWGVEEILDHSPGSVRLARLKGAGPLLWNHDRNAVIGRLENVRLDGRRLLATARFAPATNKLAEEKWRDVQAGILRETSIGYRVYAAKLEKTTDEIDTYRVSDWEPFEGSIVSIPADTSVGAGRAASASDQDNPPFKLPQNHSRSMSDTATVETSTKKETPAPVNADAIRTEARTAEAERIRAIDTMADKFKDKVPGIIEAARSAIRDGKSLDDFRTWLLEDGLKAKPITSAAPSLEEMQRDGKREYSVLRVLRSMDPTDKGRVDIGFEREVSEALRNSAVGNTKRRGDFTFPGEVFGIGLRDVEIDGKRTMQATTPSSGGFTVATNLGTLVDKLDNMMVVGKLGVQRLSGLQGNVAVPRQTGGATAYWVAENGAITDSELTFDMLALTPKTVGATSPVSKQLIVQSSTDAEGKVRRDLQLRLALAQDKAFFQGTGGAQPLGLFNQTLASVAGTPEAGKVSKITYGAAADWAKVTNIIAQLLTANVPLSSVAHVIDPTSWAKWATKSVDAGSGVFLWQGRADGGTVGGYAGYTSNHLPSNKSASGAWNNAGWATWGGVDVVVDPYALKKQQALEVTIYEMVDFWFEHLEAFVVSTDSAAQ